MAISNLDILLVLIAALVPPIFYVIWLRNAEVCNRETMSNMIWALLVGGLFSLGLAYVIESLTVTLFFGSSDLVPRPFWILDPDTQLIVLACIVAPIVEEATKGMGILFFRKHFTELENGFVYGAAVGLGFAAFENILYEVNAITVGLSVFIGTAVARALTSTVLHASSSSLLGFGIVRRSMTRVSGSPTSVWPYYLAAVAMHSVFNMLAIIGVLSNSELYALIGLVAGLLLVQQTLRWIRGRIQDLDRTTACPKGTAPYKPMLK